MSSGGVEGPIPRINPITTSEPTKTEEATLEGKTSTGALVTKEGVNTPLKDGIDQRATPDTSIEDRNPQLVPTEEVTVEVAANHLELLSDTVNDNLDGDQYFENPAVVPDELQWVRDEDVAQLADVKAAFNPFKSIKDGAQRLGRALTKFVQHFRAEKDVTQEMAGAMAKLTEAKVNDGDSVKGAAKSVAEMLEDSPKKLLEGLEAQGLNDVVADLKNTFKVATAKNLAKMKSRLVQPEVMQGMNAVQGMSEQKAELIINGALILAKLANAGGGTDSSSIEGRGYLVGRIPNEKFQVVEWLLSLDPEVAMLVIKTHPRLRDTNFAAELRSADRKVDDAVLSPVGERDEAIGPWTENGGRPMRAREKVANSVEDIFEEGALPMFEHEEAVAELSDNIKAFMDKRKNEVAKERRERAGKHFEDTGLKVTPELLAEGISKLQQIPDPDVSRDFKLKIQEHKEKFGSIAEQAAAKARDKTAQRQLEAERNAAVEQLMNEHTRLRAKYDDTNGSKLPEEQLQTVTKVYEKLHKEMNGLMFTRTSKDGVGLFNRDNSKANVKLFTNAVMVACGYAVYRDENGASGIIDTLHGVREQNYQGMSDEDAAAAMVNKETKMAQAALSYVQLLKAGGPEALSEMLKGNPVLAKALQ